MRRSVASALVAVLALAASTLAACSADEPPAPVTEQRGPRGAVPVGLERYYGQPLTWEDCAPYARTDADRQTLRAPGLRCARLTVPLDYTAPGGDTITLGLSRKPATDDGNRIGSLVINPGGPGVSGLSTAARLSGVGGLNRLFDFVGFDPRGTGSSEPVVRCLTDAERDAERADDDELDTSPQGVAKAEADQRDYATKCAERTGKGAAMLANIGTRDVARDVDVLRSALGDEKLTYLGYSYGTRIGSTYAEAFPGNVRAMVLDGAVDPTQDAVAELVAQATGFQSAFTDFVAWCVQRQDCALGRDATRALRSFHALVRPLAERPIETGDGRRLSYSDATTGVTQALYSEQLWELLNTGLNELKQNRSHTLMALADAYLERDKSGRYTTTQDAFVAVRCVDDTRVTDRAAVLEAQQRYKQAAPFLDDGKPASDALDACAFWPVPTTSTPHLPSVEGLPPVLVISTTGDPATPYEAGVALAKALGGRLLTYEATQHTAFLQGVRCVDDAGSAYLTELRLPQEGVRCSA
ncbi:alpha/beta hydrolase [Actinokineospora cianjurensis]|uniref:Alpha/beta hydrolase family protein n=1 Tax=Actinokineospora cianjurensis TaxID=585224 RepID=A0A421AY00_9PSEU|nr:alpha/beta hydrolase [Actinokineospora cianjurensis]RLK54747.1 alpha/beta hydrolase family protein [Actinokineospora cianjurensis]